MTMAPMAMGPESKEPETELGRFLLPRAQARGLNKSQLAKKLGTIYPTVQAWFTAKKNAVPKLPMLEKIAEVLELTPHERDQLLAIARGARQLAGDEAYSVPSTETSHVAERTIEYTPRYHNAALALRQLREGGTEVPSEVVSDVVEGVSLASEEDPPVKFWRASFTQQLELRATYRHATLDQIRKHLGGVAVSDDDVPRPKLKRR
jgi:transcriptional regulator with XRE-family HTH domain